MRYMSDVDYLNGAKGRYAVKNSSIGDDIFDKNWKELCIREYADRIELVK